MLAPNNIFEFGEGQNETHQSFMEEKYERDAAREEREEKERRWREENW